MFESSTCSVLIPLPGIHTPHASSQVCACQYPQTNKFSLSLSQPFLHFPLLSFFSFFLSFFLSFLLLVFYDSLFTAAPSAATAAPASTFLGAAPAPTASSVAAYKVHLARLFPLPCSGTPGTGPAPALFLLMFSLCYVVSSPPSPPPSLVSIS